MIPALANNWFQDIMIKLHSEVNIRVMDGVLTSGFVTNAICYVLNVSPKFPCWNPNPYVMASGSGIFGDVIKLGGHSPYEWDYCPHKMAHRHLLVPSITCRHRQKVPVLWIGSRPHGTWNWQGPYLGLQIFRNKFLLFISHKVYGDFVIASYIG